MSELVVEGLRAAVDGQGILKGVDLVVKSAYSKGPMLNSRSEPRCDLPTPPSPSTPDSPSWPRSFSNSCS